MPKVVYDHARSVNFYVSLEIVVERKLALIWSAFISHVGCIK